MTDLPYLVRKAQHKIGKPGRRSEKRLGKELGGRLRPASGALPGAKADLDMGVALVEAKSTTQASLGVKLDWLCKIAAEARSEGKTPALAMSFVTQQGEPQMDGDWVAIPMYKFREMFEWG